MDMGNSAKVVIQQEMKGRRHKYGFNNNEREKAQKKRVVDDETADKHQLDEIMGSPPASTTLPPSPPPPSPSSPPRPPPTSDTSASTFAVKRTHKASHLRSLSTRPPGVERPVVHVDPATGKADGPHKKKLRTYLGIVARDKVDITYENWKEVPTAHKDLIWEDIQEEFDIPEASDSRTKRKLLQTDGVEDTVCDKYGISKEKWAQFCQTRRGPSWEDVRIKAQAIQKQNTAPHVLSRGGYDYLEQKLLAEKTKKKMQDAAQSGSADGIIDPPSPVRRHVKWKMARTKKTREMTTEAAKEIAEKIDSFEEQVTQGSFVPHGRQDVLAAAIGRLEHPGRVRAAGAGVTIKQYFGSAPRTSRSASSLPSDELQQLTQQIRDQLEESITEKVTRQVMASFSQLQSQMQSQGPPEPLVGPGPSGPRVSTKGSCVDPSGNDPETGDSDRCGLYIEADPASLVSVGRVYEGSTLVHNTPLLPGQVKVSVDEVKDADVAVPVPITEVSLVGQALHTFLAWPTHLIKSLSNQVAVSLPKPPPKPDPKVRWDATVFGVVNPDFPLYIKHEDLSEITHGGQCLSISVLQLWILHLTETCMRAGNSDIYGFLEPQSIQRSGQSQFESESYIKSWMQSSQRDVFHCSRHWQMVVILPKEHLVVWFCSLHNRPDNYLKGIINSAIKGLDDAPQPKSKAPARWIVVKCNRQKGTTECGYYVMHWMSTIILGSFRNNWEAYFNDPRPLEPERLKALWIQWAHGGVNEPHVDCSNAFNTSQWARTVAHENGFVAVIIRSDTDTGSKGRSSFVLIGCERSGMYKCRNKEFVRRDTGSRKYGCPFRLHGKPVHGGEGWMVKLIYGIHNHELAKSLVGHPYAGRLTKDEKKIIADMTKSMVKPKNILLTLKEHNANSCTTIKQIYNARSAYRSSIRGPNTEMQHLMKLLEHSTYKTNRYKLPLLDFVGVTPTAMTFSVGFAYLETERINNIVWALERFRGLYIRNDRLPVVIVTDRDLALMNAVKIVFPECTNLLCRIESTDWALKIVLQNSLGDLCSVWDAMNNMITLQHVEIKASFETSTHVVGHVFKKILYKRLLRMVSRDALNEIASEVDRLCYLDNNPSSCDCVMRSTHGLPCACELSRYTVGSIPVESIHIFWRRLCFSDQGLYEAEVSIKEEIETISKRFEELNVCGKVTLKSKLRDIAYPGNNSMCPPPAKVNTKGAPKKSMKRSQRSTKLKRSASCSEPPQPTRIIPMLDQFAPFIQGFILDTVDVKVDSNCGYRSIATLLGMGEDSWPLVHNELIKEFGRWSHEYINLFGGTERFEQLKLSLLRWPLVHNELIKEFGRWSHEYVNLFGGTERFEQLKLSLLVDGFSKVSVDKWMDITKMGYVIASRYNVILVSLSQQQSMTFFPLRSQPPPDSSGHRMICVGNQIRFQCMKLINDDDVNTMLMCNDQFLCVGPIEFLCTVGRTPDGVINLLQCTMPRTHDAILYYNEKWNMPPQNKFVGCAFTGKNPKKFQIPSRCTIDELTDLIKQVAPKGIPPLGIHESQTIRRLFFCQPGRFEYSDKLIKYEIKELKTNDEVLKVLVQSNYWKKYGPIEILAVFTKYVMEFEDEVTVTSLND
ncbi:hypothetical protein HKD37_05G012474 [Glycine soja]